MRLSQLRYVVAVYDTGGFTKAALACHIAQSSVSQAISAPEREFGVALFERQGRSVMPAPAGEYLVRRARVLLDEVDDIAREARRIGGDDELTLRIGFVGGVRHEILEAMGSFAEAYPEVTPIIVGGDYREQTERLRDGEIDLAIFERREELPDAFVTYDIAELPSWIELSTRNPLARRAGVRVADLRGKPLIITSSPGNREVERAYFRQVLGYPDDFVYVGTRDESVLLIVGNRGYEQCDHVPGHETPHPGLTKVALVGDDGSQLHRPLVAVWLKTRAGYYVEEFAAALRQAFADELAGTVWEVDGRLRKPIGFAYGLPCPIAIARDGVPRFNGCVSSNKRKEELTMRIDHLAIHVNDLEGAAKFFEEYFGAKVDETYHNPRTGLRSNFLKLDEGPRFEIMCRPGLVEASSNTMSHGYTHMAFALGSEAAVDELTERLRAGGYEILSGPRVTGDGYYETSLLGWEGINIEITV